jgi:lipopolysaccharide export system ATP-binding protein
VKPLLAAESIGKSFGSRSVLRTASMWAQSGTVTALLGRNGCGKTTLVKITIGQLRANRGVVIYDGKRILRPRLHDLARAGLYYLPERNLLSSAFTVREHLDAVRLLFPDAKVDRAIELLRVGEFLERKLRTLSGGEKRRCEAAIALARSPRCLLADEPYMGIMPTDAILLTEAFRRMAHIEGCAVLVTGHEVNTVLELADEVIWQTAGTTHHLGTSEEAQRHDQFRREYLGAALKAPLT